MKYSLLIATASLFLFSFRYKEEKKSTTADLKKTFVESCVSEAVSEEDPPELQKIFKEFCTCAGDKVFAQFSVEEIEKLEAGDEDVMVKTLQPYIESCVADLEKKIETLVQE